MMRRLLASLAIMGVALALSARADEPAKPKTGDPSEAIKTEAALKQEMLAQQFREFSQALLRMAQSLEKSTKPEDREKAVILKQAIEYASKEGVDNKFDKLISILKKQDKVSLNEINDAIALNQSMTKDLRTILQIILDDRNAKLKEERRQLQDLLKRLDEAIRDQKIARAQTEAGRMDKKDLGNQQEKVTKDTEKIAKAMGGKENDKPSASKGEGKDAKKDDGKGGEGKGETKNDTKDPKAGEKDAKGGEGKPGNEGKPSDKDAKTGEPKDGKGGEGKAGEGKPTDKDAKGGEGKGGEGKDKDGKAGEGKDGKGGEGKPGEGKPGEGKGKDGKGGEGKPGEGKPGQPKESKPGEGKPGEGKGGKPGEGKPGEGKPGEGKAGEGKPSQGQGKGEGGKGKGEGKGEGKGGEGKGGEGKPSEGKGQGSQGQKGQQGQGKGDQQPGGQQPPPGGQQPPPPGGQQAADARKKIQDATGDQKNAEDNIAKDKKQDASANQNDAIKKMEEARKKLEDILRQMREEEIERLLADLQARCQRMLAMQIAVYENTVTIDRTIGENPGKKPTRNDEQKALQQADREGEIVREANKAIQLLEEEGSAVAFSEVFTQVRDDMVSVQRRLGKADVATVTQVIEKEIIATLQEMIEALKKARQENKQPPKPSKPGQQGPPPPKSLIDLLAELKMIRSMQIRVNNRTITYSKEYVGEQADNPDIQKELKNLAERQDKIVDVTKNIATGKNQ